MTCNIGTHKCNSCGASTLDNTLNICKINNCFSYEFNFDLSRLECKDCLDGFQNSLTSCDSCSVDNCLNCDNDVTECDLCKDDLVFIDGKC